MRRSDDIINISNKERGVNMVRSIEMLYEEMNDLVCKCLENGYIICNDNASYGGIISKCTLLNIDERLKIVVYITRKYTSYTDELYKKYGYRGDIYSIRMMRDTIRNIESELQHDLSSSINNMEEIYKKDYCELSASYNRHKGYTDDIDDVIEFCRKRNERDTRDLYASKDVFYKDIDRLRIALNRVKREPRTKMIHLENIDWVKKDGCRYLVSYTTNNGTNRCVYIK